MGPTLLVGASAAYQATTQSWWSVLTDSVGSFLTKNSPAISAAASAASTLILFTAALIAWGQVKEAKRMREEQTRPFVVVDFDVMSQFQFINLTVSNIGRTMAKDVRITFDPPLWSSMDDRPNITKAADIAFFKDGIPNLPPNKIISMLFDNWIERAKTIGIDRYEVTVRYHGPQTSKPYRDQLILDLAPYRNVLNVRSKNLDDVHREIEQIRRDIHEFGIRGDGLLVKTPADLQVERERWEQVMKEEQKKANAPDSPPSSGEEVLE